MSNDEITQLKLRVLTLEIALRKIRDKAGSNTVALAATTQGEDDAGFSGIYTVAVCALAPSIDPSTAMITDMIVDDASLDKMLTASKKQTKTAAPVSRDDGSDIRMPLSPLTETTILEWKLTDPIVRMNDMLQRKNDSLHARLGRAVATLLCVSERVNFHQRDIGHHLDQLMAPIDAILVDTDSKAAGEFAAAVQALCERADEWMSNISDNSSDQPLMSAVIAWRDAKRAVDARRGGGR